MRPKTITTASKPCETEQIMEELSTPLPNGDVDILRRRVLQTVAVAGGIAALPAGWLDQAGAVPLDNNQKGVLVHILMGGGNDGLNMVAPFQAGAYQDARGSLAISETNGIKISGQRALHPELKTVASKWDSGDVAIVEGVGLPVKNLSHFTSMAQWMSGNMSTSPANWNSGWLGRYLDGMPGAFTGVHVGTTVPLLVRGSNRNAVGLPGRSWLVYDRDHDQDTKHLDNAIRKFSTSPTGLGQLGDTVAQAARQASEASVTLKTPYSGTDLDGSFPSKMELVARLINANLGIRTISISFGSFDTHSSQAGPHNELMKAFDEGVKKFYDTLHSGKEGRTLLVTASEFGRRVKANDSQGTDHGDASTVLVIGSGAKGGMYGQLPSLTQLDYNGNMNPTVDYRSVYGSLLDTWLEADGSGVFGHNFESLDFFEKPGIVEPDPPTTPVFVGPERRRRLLERRRKLIEARQRRAQRRRNLSERRRKIIARRNRAKRA